MKEYYIGLMSGTSLDGVDGVLVDFSSTPPLQQLRVLAYHAESFTPTLRQALLDLNQPGPNELHRAALASHALVKIYATVVKQLLHTSQLKATDIRAIGAHGQTVRHCPPQAPQHTLNQNAVFHPQAKNLFSSPSSNLAPVPYTWQLNNPAQLAEDTGITVVADFRSRDMAAGGQGAPLVPAFHQGYFGQSGVDIAVLNLGGIANLSLLHANGLVEGFDCGPGNVLLDLWCQKHTGQSFDKDGHWASQGQVLPDLLSLLCQDPYFSRLPPKSTGRDDFHTAWLEQKLAAVAHAIKIPKPVDVQSTLVELTAWACAKDLKIHLPGCKKLWVCGGGAYNTDLVQRIKNHCQCLFNFPLPEVLPLQATQHPGLMPLQVEAAVFAWLARQTLQGLPSNLPAVTGAKGLRVLGCVYPV